MTARSVNQTPVTSQEIHACAAWVLELAQNRKDVPVDLLDIEKFELPLLDEPLPPSFGQTKLSIQSNGRVPCPALTPSKAPVN